MDPRDFFRGLLYPLRGLVILRRHPGMVRYWLPPIVLTTLALLASIVLATRYYDDALALIWKQPVSGQWHEALLVALYWVVRVLTFVLGIGIAMLVTVVLANLFAAPFNDALSEAVEEVETGNKAPPFSLPKLARDLGRSLGLELVKLCIYAAVMGPLLVASWLLPGIGQALYLVFASLFTWLYFAIDYVDWPASRRGLGWRDRFGLLRTRPFLMLGFGFAVATCLFVPLLNLCFMPFAVAGGTRLFLDLEALRARAL
ncbi:MAG TPA: EI24 domain-containing protein [Polyangiales bacterium]|nr:EI24 domain-containing protein [Polyangiales bacterium]